jgi:hypothetical protein
MAIHRTADTFLQSVPEREGGVPGALDFLSAGEMNNAL